jgi:hypothetical protein
LPFFWLLQKLNVRQKREAIQILNHTIKWFCLDQNYAFCFCNDEWKNISYADTDWLFKMANNKYVCLDFFFVLRKSKLRQTNIVFA